MSEKLPFDMEDRIYNANNTLIGFADSNGKLLPSEKYTPEQRKHLRLTLESYEKKKQIVAHLTSDQRMYIAAVLGSAHPLASYMPEMEELAVQTSLDPSHVSKKSKSPIIIFNATDSSGGFGSSKGKYGHAGHY